MTFKRIVSFLLLAILALAAVVGVKTWRTPSRQVSVAPIQKAPVDAKAVAERLAGAVRFKTISSLEDPQANNDQFAGLHAYLAQQFPALHATMKLEQPGDNALVYVWPGSNAKAQPIALMAHQDVVPIASGTENKWQAEPFAGTIRDGYVWGRGAWDDKGNLLAQMEAIELLAKSGFKPERTIYLISGADEEVGGHRGAERIGQKLKAQGIRFAWVLDEGLLVTEGVLPGLNQPAALVGVAEKGYASFKLSVEATPGHSSMPPLHGSAIGTMGGALSRLEAHQMPATLDGGVARSMFDTLAPEMSGFGRVALSNLWLFGPLVQKQLSASPASNAMLRTTTALTIIEGGNKDNVLPGHVEATVNFRVLPGDTLASVEEHVHKVVANDAVKVAPYPGNAEPSPVSPTDGPGYVDIQKTIRQVFPEGVVAPGLMLGATDGRHMAVAADAVYRFSPVRAKPEDLPRFHGTNERISIDNYVEMIQFYHQLLRNAGVAAPQG
ncbi:M20 family peptidase [Variovorax dokdonensis]|uniref:M20 family peptidase n=1 Tax=Variovorax dokdonensis TaxID=344883 RepID=A0ABT7NGW6_9BURK|nr:M20 family peptidase [Variovorax dokdonensis]MDM0047179.1 M20 family peptidase [Variovorax dokdonensis]